MLKLVDMGYLDCIMLTEGFIKPNIIGRNNTAYTHLPACQEDFSALLSGDMDELCWISTDYVLCGRLIMEIQFRPAQSGDVKQAVPLIYSSGPEIFDFIFGHKTKGSAHEYLTSAFLNGKGELGFQNLTLAVVDDLVVGSGTCFSGTEKSRFKLPGARHIISYYGLVDCWRVMLTAQRVEQVLIPPKVDLHYICYLGVAPEWRGQGIGTQMIRYLLEQGRRAKRTLAALDVSVDNPHAQALYERLGFKVVGERESDLSNEFGVVGPHRRMEIYL